MLSFLNDLDNVSFRATGTPSEGMSPHILYFGIGMEVNGIQMIAANVLMLP